jgi:hypothetical protein
MRSWARSNGTAISSSPGQRRAKNERTIRCFSGLSAPPSVADPASAKHMVDDHRKRQALHVKWTRPASLSQAQEREHIEPRQENNMRPPNRRPPFRHPNDGDFIATPPPRLAEPSLGQIDRIHGQSSRARGKNNLRRSVNEDNRSAPLATPYVGDSKPAVQGFWDWSR